MTDKLTKAVIRALKALSLHEGRFQPLELRSSITTEAVEHLIGLGFAERGDCDPRFVEWGYPIGYRLTSAGKTALIARRQN